MKNYTLEQLARMIDHTNLHAYASSEDMKKLCQEAKENHFKMVAINQLQTAYCAKLLKDTNVGIGAAISFPLGQTTIESKVFDTKDAIENGATEIDYVVNITALKDQQWGYIKEEMEQITKLCREHDVISKVIFETCYLNDAEKIKLCEIAKEVEPDFIKTSTGFGTNGATLEDVKLMKDHVGDKVKVKASGGVRDVETFIAMIKNGAQRIGTSSGIKIINEIDAMLKTKKADFLTIE